VRTPLKMSETKDSKEEQPMSFGRKIAAKIRDTLYNVSGGLREAEEVDGFMKFQQQTTDESRVFIYCGAILAFAVAIILIAFYYTFNRQLQLQQQSILCPKLDTACLTKQSTTISNLTTQWLNGQINQLQCQCLDSFSPDIFSGAGSYLSVRDRCTNLKPANIPQAICDQMDGLVTAHFNELSMAPITLFANNDFTLATFRLYQQACYKTFTALKDAAIMEYVLNANVDLSMSAFLDNLINDLQYSLESEACRAALAKTSKDYGGKFCDRQNAICFGAEGGESFTANVGYFKDISGSQNQIFVPASANSSVLTFPQLVSPWYTGYLRACKGSVCTWFNTQNDFDLFLAVTGQMATVIGVIMLPAAAIYQIVASKLEEEKSNRDSGREGEGHKEKRERKKSSPPVATTV